MNESGLMRRLEAYVQEEIGAQRRLLEILETQEHSIRSGDSAALAEQGREIERELRTRAERARRRSALLELFGRLWDVAPGTLTLSSICERAGDEAGLLLRQKDDLRNVVAAVTRSSRRLSSAARLHRRLIAEVIETVLAGEDEACVAAGGTLVDAEV